MKTNTYQGTHSINHSKYDESRGTVVTKSYTGFYLFMATLLGVGGWVAYMLINLL